MATEYVGRKRDNEYYRWYCDEDGCNNQRTFQADETDHNWKVAKMFEDGVVTEIRHICPKH